MTDTQGGRFVYETATSIDGWIADGDNSLSWLFAVPVEDEDQARLAPLAAPVQVMGSTTYLWVLEEMGALEDPTNWSRAFAPAEVFVFTSRELPVPDGARITFLSGDVASHLGALRRAADGGDVWVIGGGDLAAQFMEAGVLDEVVLSVAPVMLGSGAPLFPRRLDADRLSLVSATRVGEFARLTYRVSP
ncbi:dihydrofolate reductase family protein [Brevibacterium yomogidense]|uniref:dihydrofolate reductase family protein n=1 Tax=Brevibacterium yomogidense TaxID=946573 RepID=UPI0018DF7360|nr:dihydrofolate reductase family protein [Brevibacterium yomogidense]